MQANDFRKAFKEATVDCIPTDEQDSGKTIVGDINLDSIDYAHKLILQNCTFRGHFDNY